MIPRGKKCKSNAQKGGAGPKGEFWSNFFSFSIFLHLFICSLLLFNKRRKQGRVNCRRAAAGVGWVAKCKQLQENLAQRSKVCNAKVYGWNWKAVRQTMGVVIPSEFWAWNVWKDNAGSGKKELLRLHSNTSFGGRKSWKLQRKLKSEWEIKIFQGAKKVNLGMKA